MRLFSKKERELFLNSCSALRNDHCIIIYNHDFKTFLHFLSINRESLKPFCLTAYPMCRFSTKRAPLYHLSHEGLWRISGDDPVVSLQLTDDVQVMKIHIQLVYQQC